MEKTTKIIIIMFVVLFLVIIFMLKKYVNYLLIFGLILVWIIITKIITNHFRPKKPEPSYELPISNEPFNLEAIRSSMKEIDDVFSSNIISLEYSLEQYQNMKKQVQIKILTLGKMFIHLNKRIDYLERRIGNNEEVIKNVLDRNTTPSTKNEAVRGMQQNHKNYY